MAFRAEKKYDSGMGLGDRGPLFTVQWALEDAGGREGPGEHLRCGCTLLPGRGSSLGLQAVCVTSSRRGR